METPTPIISLKCLFWFKSYYVVWKQIEEAGVGDTPTRLNRTM